jgi:hypothetical protein
METGTLALSLGEAGARDLSELGRSIATRQAFGEAVSTAAEELFGTQQHLDEATRYTPANPYARELGRALLGHRWPAVAGPAPVVSTPYQPSREVTR